MPTMPLASRVDDALFSPTARPAGATMVAFVTMALAVVTAAAPLVAQGTPMTLKAAYDAGRIMISVEIAADDKRGDRLQLTIEPIDKPLTITVPTETTSLVLAPPFDVLAFRAPTAQTLALTAEKPAKLVVNQVGELRFVAGKFQIAVDEGRPQFVGSATTDVVKP